MLPLMPRGTDDDAAMPMPTRRHADAAMPMPGSGGSRR
jgi:hypothetical protein